MNRSELITYLKNICNLEILRHVSANMIKNYQTQIEKAEVKIKKRSIGISLDAAEITRLIISLILIGIGISSLCYSLSAQEIGGFSKSMLMITVPLFTLIISIAVGVGPFCALIGDIFSIPTDINYNNHIKEIVPAVTEEIQSLESEILRTQNELATLNGLLAEAYSFNVIPVQYRSLTYMLYIYDYVSTSQQTLENAFLHSHIEDGVKQITGRLNIIIEQNIDMIRLLRQNISVSSTINSKLDTLSSDTRLNTHFSNVNNFYLNSTLY